ncbi:DUF4280 domain-containing protein [Apibacter muscae]|uniref:DUF4280 domain-containing protein n=1 Tax=Apibacter muscae TaxID=2509004 RepID=UPI0016258024|nr:DUF4280 domain-containing protein [Apibacter muscae]
MRSYHNNICELNNLLGWKVKAGTELLLEKEKPSQEKLQEIEERQEEQKIQEFKEERESHEGSHFLVHGAKCICNKGSNLATLKVISNRYTPFNNNREGAYAATEEGVQFEEGSFCFGSCKLRKNDPCIFSPAGKWQKPYNYVKIYDMKTLTELSYLNCTQVGKITVHYHGQKIKIGFMHLQRADTETLNMILPGLELQEYMEEQDTDQYYI